MAVSAQDYTDFGLMDNVAKQTYILSLTTSDVTEFKLLSTSDEVAYIDYILMSTTDKGNYVRNGSSAEISALLTFLINEQAIFVAETLSNFQQNFRTSNLNPALQSQLVKPIVMQSDGSFRQTEDDDILDARTMHKEVFNGTVKDDLAVPRGAFMAMVDGKFELAVANTQSLKDVKAVFYSDDIGTGDSRLRNVQKSGVISMQDWSAVALTVDVNDVSSVQSALTPGKTYFLDPVSKGKIRDKAPQEATSPIHSYVCSVGFAITATEFYISIEPTIRF